MPFTPLTFTGISQYSDDLNTVLKRAVSIASLPLTRLQNDDADILSKKTSLSSLTGSVGDLASSLTALGTLAAKKGLDATSSDSSTVSVAYNGAASPASYTISEITSVASAASENSLVGYADTTSAQVSATGDLHVVIGGTSQPIHLTAGQNNLAGLRDAINALGLGVNATIISTGTGLTPNYLSLSATATGATTLQLLDDGAGAANLLTSANQGSDAHFKVNGFPVSKPSNQITDVIPGATFEILQRTSGGQTVTLSLSSSRFQLGNAIQDFATRYNSLVDAVGKQVGPNAGLLAGDFLVRQVQDNLRQLTSFQGSGAIQNLSDLGISLGQDGKITFEAATFNGLSAAGLDSAFDFFGSQTTGFAAQAKAFNNISDPITGLAQLQQESYDAADKRIQNDIATLNDRITNLQASVTARLQAADALLATLDSQQKILTASISALNFTSFGKPTSN